MSSPADTQASSQSAALLDLLCLEPTIEVGCEDRERILQTHPLSQPLLGSALARPVRIDYDGVKAFGQDLLDGQLVNAVSYHGILDDLA